MCDKKIISVKSDVLENSLRFAGVIPKGATEVVMFFEMPYSGDFRGGDDLTMDKEMDYGEGGLKVEYKVP